MQGSRTLLLTLEKHQNFANWRRLRIVSGTPFPHISSTQWLMVLLIHTYSPHSWHPICRLTRNLDFSAPLTSRILFRAKIILHEPYAMVGKASCFSASKILGASRAILDLIYMLTSSSFDIRKIGLFPVARIVPVQCCISSNSY